MFMFLAAIRREETCLQIVEWGFQITRYIVQFSGRDMFDYPCTEHGEPMPLSQWTSQGFSVPTAQCGERNRCRLNRKDLSPKFGF